MTRTIQQIVHAMRSDRGLVRRVNEDTVAALADRGVWVVADGMGGHAHGRFASAAVAESVMAVAPELAGGDLMRGVREALMHAHALIVAEGQRLGGVTIGSTAVALVIADGHFVGLWAGDSRLYLLRDGVLTRISRDHSLVADLVEEGQITPEAAERHPQANVITRAVGVGTVLDLDKRRGEVEPGDRFLLCSDGLTRYVDDAALEGLLAGAPVATVVDRLIERALAGGGGDNVSVIVVEVGPEDG